MTRKYTDVLIAELATTLPDNTTGLITPAILRQVITDTIESLRPAWAGIRADKVASPVNFSVTGTWQKLNAVGLWTAGGQSDNAEFSYDLANGELVAKVADFNHLVQCAINFAGATGNAYHFSLALNGVPVGTVAPVDGSGTGRILEATDLALITSNAINDRFSIMVRSPDGNSTIQISQMDLFGNLQTTRYP